MHRMLRSKIHRATVTHADLEYEGSITLPPDLLEASGILPFEAVNIWNVTRGTRLETYALRGTESTRPICVNGAAAHLVKPGDIIIIAVFALYTPEEAQVHTPRVVFVDSENAIKGARQEVPGPLSPPSYNEAMPR